MLTEARGTRVRTGRARHRVRGAVIDDAKDPGAKRGAAMAYQKSCRNTIRVCRVLAVRAPGDASKMVVVLFGHEYK
jgi:hypothetical protein